MTITEGDKRRIETSIDLMDRFLEEIIRESEHGHLRQVSNWVHLRDDVVRLLELDRENMTNG